MCWNVLLSSRNACTKVVFVMLCRVSGRFKCRFRVRCTDKAVGQETASRVFWCLRSHGIQRAVISDPCCATARHQDVRNAYGNSLPFSPWIDHALFYVTDATRTWLALWLRMMMGRLSRTWRRRRPTSLRCAITAASGAYSYGDYGVLSAPPQTVSEHASAHTVQLIKLHGTVFLQWFCL